MRIAQMACESRSAAALSTPLRAPAAAFDAIADSFDSRFGSWLSVAAQRRAVRTALLRALPARGSILEIGGGTGEDAAFLAAHGLRVHLTDPSPNMVSIASRKLAPLQCRADVAAAEDLEAFAADHFALGGSLFDGAYSNFAALNCVTDLRSVAKGLGKLLKPGAPAMLVVFGVLCPGEILTEALRGRTGNALRRLKSGAVPAKLSGRVFKVVYHRRSELETAFAPWFECESRLGIGITVPPSAAEPWISEHYRLLDWAERIDNLISRPLAMLGDHVLYRFRRSTAN